MLFDLKPCSGFSSHSWHPGRSEGSLRTSAFALAAALTLSSGVTNESTPATPNSDVFGSKIRDHCDSQGYDFSYPLPDHVCQQLSWLMANEINSPELRDKLPATDLNMEIKRSLARLYCFDLLLREDISPQAAYRKFIASQEGTVMAFENFELLRRQANALSLDEQEVIRISCVLTKSQHAEKLLKANGIRDVPADSEEFLTWLSRSDQALQLFPVCRGMNDAQKAMLGKVYVPVHGRAIPFTEGSLLMTVKASEINKLWEMRWWTNLMGFRGHEGYGAKYLHEARFQFFQDCYRVIDQNKDHPDLIARLWLGKIIENSQLEKYPLTTPEMMVVAHLLTFYGEYLPDDKVKQVVEGFAHYKKQYPQECENLVVNYNKFLLSSLKTPTYAPAVLHTAESILKNATHRVWAASPATLGTSYTLQLLQQLHDLIDRLDSNQKAVPIISCREEAWRPVIKERFFEVAAGEAALKCHIKESNGEHLLSCVAELSRSFK